MAHVQLTRRQFVGTIVASVTAVALAGCQVASAPAPAAPTQAPASTTAPTTPSGTGKQAAAADWQAAWQQAQTAGKSEGTVSLIGPIGSAFQSTLDTFQKEYGISVNLWAAQGPEIAPKVITERNGGQFNWDVFISGTTTGLVSLIPAGAFDPLEPALILPEVTDPSQWRGGGMEFVDPGRTLLVMTPRQRGIVFYNTDAVQPEQITSYKDLLDPKWKSQIEIDDPRHAGPGQATFVFFYLHPDLGADFIRSLAQQDLTIMNDYTAEANAVGKGEFPLLVGGNDYSAEPLMNQGVPIGILNPQTVKEGSDVSSGSGNVALMNRAPHPNAAQVYINWLLSQEGQTQFAGALEYISARVDVSTAGNPFPWRVPVPGSIKSYDQAAMTAADQLRPLLAEVFGSS